MFNIEDIEKSIEKMDKMNQEDKKVYVYMGSYAMVNGIATLTYNGDKSFVYKKYRDIESGNTFTVNKDSIDAFEKGKRIIFPVVEDFTPEGYEKTFQVVKEVYNKEASTTSKEDAYKLIKRLTPLK